MKIAELFTDTKIVVRIQERLPSLFHLAELESSRGGNVGMEVGSIREKIVIALLIYKFGEHNVETDIPTTQPDVDVKVFNEPISVKTITGKSLNGVKLIWTVDEKKASEFSQSYAPSSDMLLVQVNWNNSGWFYLFPKSVQVEIFNQVGSQTYIKLPKPGTNPRGVEIAGEALRLLANHPKSLKIPINWLRETIDYNPYERWLELWQKD
ncbi:ThaI family type II restriction endonuclease [Synechococcus sp. C9]|uniref:ThaI family type II restriction endonuclease n=1 Tax=Synechococcus sp. C9 TaxID=102119 RepID=UPI001FF47ADC|nr:ThaI family type II restriction endonuclease [Synechococcus sp. C9]